MKYFPKVSRAMAGAAIAIVGTTSAGQAITTTGDPLQYITPTNIFSGVALLELEKISGDKIDCTGSLLAGGAYVLTAAHCLTDFEAKGVFDTSATTVDFSIQSTNGFKTSVTDYYINPGWTGKVFDFNDIAVLKLAEQAPVEIEQYDINRIDNEVGQVFTAVGFGLSGTGDTGVTIDDTVVKRFGQNRFDVTIYDTALLGDFDNGNSANDFFGNVRLQGQGVSGFVSDTGLGLSEVNIAPGDSGGPGLIDGKIAGIASFEISDCRFNTGCLTDINTTRDSSFGEVFGYTRVSSHVDFIDDAIAGRIVAVPEPSTNLGLIVFGAYTILAISKRHCSSMEQKQEKTKGSTSVL